jgi:Leucine-rich repeat (LRR) protein
MPELINLTCSGNQLSNLDVSNNNALRSLWCNNCQLTELDVSNNSALEELLCSGNQLTTLRVINNTVLMILYCSGNQLTTLDLSKNTVLGLKEHLCDIDLDLSRMPTLSKVCVWVTPFPPPPTSSEDCFKIVIKTDGSPNIYYTTDCN